MTEQETVVAPEPDPEPDPHAEHVATGEADQDCRDCERAWEYWNRGGPW